MNLRAMPIFRGARASRVLVSASRRNELPSTRIAGRIRAFRVTDAAESSRRRDAFASTRDARAPRKSAAHAFTFVEVLAAMVFLGILMPVVVSVLMVANRAAVVAERSTIAAQLGENKLGELMLGNAWTSAGTRGDFGEDRPGYRWQLTKATWQTGAMTELTLDVLFKVQGTEHNARLSTLVDESLTTGSTTTTP